MLGRVGPVKLVDNSDRQYGPFNEWDEIVAFLVDVKTGAEEHARTK